MVDNTNYETDLLFDLIHIDGEHTESAVVKDLYFSIENLTQGGVIVVDDIWHPLFPGITSGVMKVVHELNLAPFLSTRNKMWLCRPEYYELYFEKSLSVLKENRIRYSTGVVTGDSITGTGDLHTYDISNAVNGFTLISVERITRFEQLTNLGLVTSSQSRKYRYLLNEFCPPIFKRLIKNLRFSKQ